MGLLMTRILFVECFEGVFVEAPKRGVLADDAALGRNEPINERR
jgi:hypothetical protein